MNLYRLPEIAERLGKSPRWLKEFLRRNPHGRLAGRDRIFTDDDLKRLIDALPKAGERKQCRSSSSRQTRRGASRTIGSVEPISASTLIAQQKQRIAEQRRKSLQDGNCKLNVVKLPARES